MSDLQDLLANRRAAEDALAAAEGDLLADLVAAKDAHRANPTQDSRARKAAAVEAVQEYRAATRAGRSGHGVGGDAFLSHEQNEG